MEEETLSKEMEIKKSMMHINHDISFSGLTSSLINQHITSLNADNRTMNC